MKQEEKKQYKNLEPWVQDAIDRYPAVTWTHANSVPLFLAGDRQGERKAPPRQDMQAVSLPGISQLTGDDKPRTFPRYNADERDEPIDPIHPPVSDPPVPNRAHTEM